MIITRRSRNCRSRKIKSRGNGFFRGNSVVPAKFIFLRELFFRFFFFFDFLDYTKNDGVFIITPRLYYFFYPMDNGIWKFDFYERKVSFKILRYGLYFVVVFAVVIALWGLAKHYQTDTFAEHGLVENLQLGLLFLSTVCFSFLALRDKFYRPVLFFLAGLTAFCFVRELDSFFDKLLPVVTWKFAWLFPLLALFYAWSHRYEAKAALFKFLDSTAFDLLFVALIVFVPLAQAVGHVSFIRDSVGDFENMSDIRRLIEESLELVAYVLIFLSAPEIYFSLIKEKH